jgi:3-oxoacyl-(acyl-carrier-protein) synthase
MRRVVVTGLGLVTPLATGVEETWSRLLDGQSGAGPITLFDAEASGVATTYACEVTRGDGTDGSLSFMVSPPLKWLCGMLTGPRKIPKARSALAS